MNSEIEEAIKVFRREKEFDLAGFMQANEEGSLLVPETLRLYAYLIRTGRINTIRPFYTDTEPEFYASNAAKLIESGIIGKDGSILKSADAILEVLEPIRKQQEKTALEQGNVFVFILG